MIIRGLAFWFNYQGLYDEIEDKDIPGENK
jgi:hypothetical protein